MCFSCAEVAGAAVVAVIPLRHRIWSLVKKACAGLSLVSVAVSASAQSVNLPQCAAPVTCQTFAVPALSNSTGNDLSVTGSVSATANVTAASSVTASSFFGDGQHLTGVTSGASTTTVANSSITFTGDTAFTKVVSFQAVGGSTFSFVSSSRVFAPTASLGTTSVSNTLAVGGGVSVFNSGTGFANSGLFVAGSNTALANPGIILRRSRGTTAVPTAVSVGDIASAWQSQTHDGTSFAAVGQLIFTANQSGTNTRGTSFSLFVATNGAVSISSAQFVATSSGRIGMGTSTPLDKVHISSGGAGAFGQNDVSGLFIDGTSAHAIIAGPVAIGHANPNAGSYPSTGLYVSSAPITIDGTGTPVSGSALCINANRQVAVCTSAVGAGGTCTCP